MPATGHAVCFCIPFIPSILAKKISQDGGDAGDRDKTPKVALSIFDRFYPGAGPTLFRIFERAEWTEWKPVIGKPFDPEA